MSAHHPTDEQFMQRALQLAALGAGHVAPNPMVGAVIVHNGVIIGEGWHRHYGQPHAEVNAVASVKPIHKIYLPESTLYVTLEPCSHHGKTPPCADLIIRENFKRVVVCNSDPNPLVAGKGIHRIREAGIHVDLGELELEGLELNRRFFHFHQQKRPYIILKWAQSANGFITKNNTEQHWITGPEARTLVHKWRSEEPAILVGSGTSLADNPKLDTRLWPGGKAPLRILIDRQARTPLTHNILDWSQPTWWVTGTDVDMGPLAHDITQLKLNTDNELLPQLLEKLYGEGIQSVLVEGGATTLQHFIEANLWDEARVFSGTPVWGKGIKAPSLPVEPIKSEMVGNDRLYHFRNSNR